MLLPLDLRLLWYFKRTAEIGSLTKAAAELGTSQPALTRHIMRLERELRVALLLRDQRGVTPTEAGALVLDKAENLLRLEQAMKGSARSPVRSQATWRCACLRPCIGS
jgi:LysR family nitrogen assimilation transcriptional regulator